MITGEITGIARMVRPITCPDSEIRAHIQFNTGQCSLSFITPCTSYVMLQGLAGDRGIRLEDRRSSASVTSTAKPPHNNTNFSLFF